MTYTPYLCMLIASPLGSEISISRTADRSDLIVTWIDRDPAKAARHISDSALVLAWNPHSQQMTGTLIDSINYTDMFLSVRQVNGTWNTPNNLTDDFTMTKGTRIPRVIPSLARVPVSYMRGLMA